MNKFVILCLLLLGGITAQAQTALKINATDPLSGRYGLSVEHRLSDTFTVGAEVDLLSREVFLEGLSWFISQNAIKRGVVAEPFVRWYPKGAEDLNGVYASLGGFFGFAKYTLDEPDGLPPRHTWSAHGASLHLGWQKRLGRLAVDMYLGRLGPTTHILVCMSSRPRCIRRPKGFGHLAACAWDGCSTQRVPTQYTENHFF